MNRRLRGGGGGNKETTSANVNDSRGTLLRHHCDPSFVFPFSMALEQNLPLSKVGGKGKSLMKMSGAVKGTRQFSVPTGACLVTSAYEIHLDNCHIDTAALARNPSVAGLAVTRQKIIDTPMPADVLSELDAWAASHLVDGWNTPIAVRSSGTVEDGAKNSFAGQYATILNVNSRHRVVEAIKQCWASQWGDHAVDYLRSRKQAGESDAPALMAVVLQVMINPSCAGVLFTTDPLCGDCNTMLIEGVWGLGEGFVSQRYTGASVVADWRKALRNEDQRVDWMSQQSYDPQTLKLQCAPPTSATKSPPEDSPEMDWIEEVPTTHHEHSTSPLSRDLARRLCSMGFITASFYGHPQDIEWALDHDGNLYLLQSRPVTRVQFSSSQYLYHIVHGGTPCVLGEDLGCRGNALHAVDLHKHMGWEIPSMLRGHRWSDQQLEMSTPMFFNRGYIWNNISEEMPKEERGLMESFCDDIWRGASVLEHTLERQLAEWEDRFQRMQRNFDDVAIGVITTTLEEMLVAYTDSCRHSWATGNATNWLEHRIEEELTSIPGAPALHELVGRLGHRHVTARKPQQELLRIARAHSHDQGLCIWMRKTLRANPGCGNYILNDMANVDGNASRHSSSRDTRLLAADLRRYVQRWAWMSDDDEDFSGPFWHEDPTFVLERFCSLIEQSSAQTNTRSEEPQPLLTAPSLSRSRSVPAQRSRTQTSVGRMVRRCAQVRSAREQLAKLVPRPSVAVANDSVSTFTFPPKEVGAQTRVRVDDSGCWQEAIVMDIGENMNTFKVATQWEVVRVNKEDISWLGIWDLLRMLSTCLQWKERVHVMYVRVGMHLKRWILGVGDRWSRLLQRHDHQHSINSKELLNMRVSDIETSLRIALTDGELQAAISTAVSARDSTRMRAMFSKFEAPYWAGSTFCFLSSCIGCQLTTCTRR